MLFVAIQKKWRGDFHVLRRRWKFNL